MDICGNNSLVENTIGPLPTSKAFPRLTEPLDRTFRIEIMAAESNDGLLAKGLPANKTRERKVLGVGIIVAVGVGGSCVGSRGLLGEEGPGRGLRGEEGVVELPTVQVVASVVEELGKGERR